MGSFGELNLNSWIARQCESVGIKQPTPIQKNCIPRILAGDDCIGCAKTGSGKTLAFALPILQKLCQDPYGIFALVLTPTRELAYQIADQFQVVGRPMNLRVCVIVGGMDMVRQGQELSKKPHIVISTPGRLADHLESCPTFSLSRIKYLVIDEADRVLAGNFDDQLQTIMEVLPSNRQTLLFSATMTDAIESVKEVISNQVFVYTSRVEGEAATVEGLNQQYLMCPEHVRDAYLVKVLQNYREKSPTGSIIIFTDTCKNCQLLSMTLQELGFSNVALHAMASQKQRLAALAQFKSNHVRILVATDVASRGLDIPTVQLVINHVMPNVPKDYIHRVGRTARAGRVGKALSLLTVRDLRLLAATEKEIAAKLEEHKVNDKEVAQIFAQVSLTRREAAVKLEESDFYEKKEINKRKDLMLQGKDPDEEMAKKAKQRRRQERKRKRDAAIQFREAKRQSKEVAASK